MEKGKVRVFDLHFLNGSCSVQLASETAFIKNEETIRVREVIELTDDEKRRVEKLKDHIKSNRLLSGEGQQFLLSLLERARVV